MTATLCCRFIWFLSLILTYRFCRRSICKSICFRSLIFWIFNYIQQLLINFNCWNNVEIRIIFDIIVVIYVYIIYLFLIFVIVLWSILWAIGILLLFLFILKVHQVNFYIFYLRFLFLGLLIFLYFKIILYL